MTSADHYRTKAAVLAAEARHAHGMLRTELLHMAQAYLRLAEQADRNQHTDVWYETPLNRGPHRASA